MILTRIGAAFLDLVYPPLCPACGEEGLSEGEPLGPECLSRVAWAQGRDCRRCGRVLGPHAERDACPDCRVRPFAFSQALAAAAYDGPVAHLILRMKARREAFWAAPLGMWLARRLAAEGVREAVDRVVCVPTRWSARAARGFNPAESIARRVARDLELPFEPAALRRRWAPAPKQTALSRANRFRNAADAFRPGCGRGWSGARVLLVDDVITTGATADACARLLRQAGAARVVAAAVARAS